MGSAFVKANFDAGSIAPVAKQSLQHCLVKNATFSGTVLGKPYDAQVTDVTPWVKVPYVKSAKRGGGIDYDEKPLAGTLPAAGIEFFKATIHVSTEGHRWLDRAPYTLEQNVTATRPWSRTAELVNSPGCQ
jgi:hypothetical protein